MFVFDFKLHSSVQHLNFEFGLPLYIYIYIILYTIYLYIIMFTHMCIFILQIFEMLIKLRADSGYRLGVCGINEYSPNVYVECRNIGVPPSPNSSIEDTKSKEDASVQLHNISLDAVCKIMITALKEEFGKHEQYLEMEFRNLMALGVEQFNCR